MSYLTSFRWIWFPFALTDAGGLVLREASGALTGEAPNRVHTEELAVVLLGRALVQIFREERNYSGWKSFFHDLRICSPTQETFGGPVKQLC